MTSGIEHRAQRWHPHIQKHLGILHMCQLLEKIELHIQWYCEAKINMQKITSGYIKINFR